MEMVVSEAEKHYFLYKQKEVDQENLDMLSSYIQEAKILRDKEMEDAQIVQQSLMQQQEAQLAQQGQQMPQ